MYSGFMWRVWVRDMYLEFFWVGLVLWWVGENLGFGKQVYFFLSGVGGVSGLRSMVQRVGGFPPLVFVGRTGGKKALRFWHFGT